VRRPKRLGFRSARRWKRFGFNPGVAAAIAAALATSCFGSAPKAASLNSIQHIVIIIKENHSFDNYFGSLQDPKPSLPHCLNPRLQDRCQYEMSDIPDYYRYAKNFGYAANYFTDARGPSWPNDMMMIAAQSPRSDDPPPPLTGWECPVNCYDFRTIGDELNDRGTSWRSYTEDAYDPFRSIQRYADDHTHNVGMPQLLADLDSADFASVAWVRPSPADSEHPGYDIHRGEAWTVSVVNAIMRSRYWSSTAIFITWDDAGSVSDHIAPPVVERLPNGKAFRYGLRVALIVISPYTRAGTVSHEFLSHVSLLKLIELRFGLEPLTFRDRDASAPMSLFDFAMPERGPLVITR